MASGSDSARHPDRLDGETFRIVEEALERVRSRLLDPPRGLPNGGLVATELDSLLEVVREEGTAAVPGGDSERHSLLGIRLLEILRSEVLEGWPVAGDSAAAGPDLLAVMKMLERVGRRLSREEPEMLGAPLLDPWARKLLGEVSHALGSSFGSMVMLTEVLASGESGEVNELQRHQLRILYRAALTLGATAGAILRLAGPLEEPGDVASRAFSMDGTLDEVEAMLAPIFEERGIELDVRFPPESVRVGRALALQRVVLALFLAAIDEAAPDRIRFHVEVGSGDAVSFSIAAPRTGEAGDPGRLSRIFQERSSGRGSSLSHPALKVASARELLRSMGAELQVEDAPDGELRFSFALDLPPAGAS